MRHGKYSRYNAGVRSRRKMNKELLRKQKMRSKIKVKPLRVFRILLALMSGKSSQGKYSWRIK